MQSRLLSILFLIASCALVAEAKVSCTNPGPFQPKYCCQAMTTVAGMMEVVREYQDDCKCNADWSSKDCTCRGIVFKTLCHHCMVNLPASNQMTTEYSYDELYTRCEDCVEKCFAEEVPGMCTDTLSTWKEEKYGQWGQDPKDVICSRDHLQKVLFTGSYPFEMKQALYRKNSYRPDKDIWMDSKWPVPGAKTHAQIEAEIRKKETGSAVKKLPKNPLAKVFVQEEEDKKLRGGRTLASHMGEELYDLSGDVASFGKQA